MSSFLKPLIKNRYFILGWLIIALSLWMQQNYTIDLYFQKFFYSNSEGWITDGFSSNLKAVLYSGTKYAIIGATLVLVYFSLRSERPSKVKRICSFIFCMAFIPAFISFLKSTTEIHCPNDLIIFNGKVPFRSIFDFESYRLFLGKYGEGNCFPGGHASGGFAFMSSFFVLPDRYKQKAIVVGFLLGSFMGLYQMMKGAHFLSHNLFTIGFSFVVISTVAEFASDD